MRNKTKILLVSLALILCFGAVTGVTMARNATAEENGGIIHGGTLHAKLTWSQDLVYWLPVADYTVFQGGLWEPSYMQLRYFDVSNVGSLDFGYRLCLRPEAGFSDLAQVLDVYCAPVDEGDVVTRDLKGLTYLGTLAQLQDGLLASDVLDSGSSQRYALVIRMQESAGNQYKGMDLGNFQIVLDANQLGADGQ